MACTLLQRAPVARATVSPATRQRAGGAAPLAAPRSAAPRAALAARVALAGQGARLTVARRASRAAARGSAVEVTAITESFREAIDKFVGEHKVVAFIKGTAQFPQCGFSNTVVQILNTLSVPYETVNVLEDDAIRTGMKEYSSWPTFPQVYIDGEFYGGCDIMIESYQDGSLAEEIEKAMSS